MPEAKRPKDRDCSQVLIARLRLWDLETPTPNGDCDCDSFRVWLVLDFCSNGSCLGCLSAFDSSCQKTKLESEPTSGAQRRSALRSKVKVAICLFCFVSFSACLLGLTAWPGLARHGMAWPGLFWPSFSVGWFLTFLGVPRSRCDFPSVNRRRAVEDIC